MSVRKSCSRGEVVPTGLDGSVWGNPIKKMVKKSRSQFEFGCCREWHLQPFHRDRPTKPKCTYYIYILMAFFSKGAYILNYVPSQKEKAVLAKGICASKSKVRKISRTRCERKERGVGVWDRRQGNENGAEMGERWGRKEVSNSESR